MPRWVWFSLTFLVATLALASLAPAAPVNYQESVSGDLPDKPGSEPALLTGYTFDFDVGTNTISGTCGFNIPANTSDFDCFAFVVPAGLQVTSASVTDSGTAAVIDWKLRTGDYAREGSLLQDISLGVPGSKGVAAAGRSPDTPYNICGESISSNSSITTVNYTFTFNVSPVPEPASLGLLALATLSLRPRRR
jgi:hypothetical protein